MQNSIKKILILFVFIIGCNNSKKKEEDVFANTGIYSNKNFSELVLTESDIADFFISNPENENIVNNVNQYYKNRNFQYAWFNKDGMTQAVPNFQNQLQNYSIDFDDKSFKIPQLDTLITLIKTNPSIKQNKLKNLELLLSTTFFKYSDKVFGGITNNPYNLNWFIPRYKKNYPILLDSLVLSSKKEQVWEPGNEYYLKLKEKLKYYRSIQENGGFPKIITSKKKVFKVTQSDSCLLKVKEYLVLTQDLKRNDKTIAFTDTLATAIIHFQRRTGLTEDGEIGPSTIAELNKPIDFRIKQIMINMERLRWFPDEIESDFLLINIPEFKLLVFENSKKNWDIKVVVGKAATRTSIFKGNISQIILNPYWNVPKSIIRNEMLPDLKRNPNYLSKNNFEVLSGNKIIDPSNINWNNYKKNIPFAIRQKPGNSNALGKIKFVFPNNYSIYLHDTPSKNLFDEPKRAFSHGCIRAQEPKKLALYLLRKDKNWNEEKIDSILLKNKTFNIALQPNMPIYIVYFTAWVNSAGELNFRNDIYNLDKQLEKEIFSDVLF